MSKKVMIDQIAFDEAEKKILAHVQYFGELINDPHPDHKVEIARSVINCMRMELFNTENSKNDKEDKIYE